MIPNEYFIKGGRPVTPIHLLLLIGEMEGTYQHLKYMGFEEDMNTLDKMKKINKWNVRAKTHTQAYLTPKNMA